MSAQDLSITPIDWRRVGALSTSFSLHGLAIALALLAVLKPTAVPEPQIEPAGALIAEWIEPEPVQPPERPLAAVQPPTTNVAPAPDIHSITTEAPLAATLHESTTASRPASSTTESIAQRSPERAAPAPASAANGAVSYEYAPAPRYPTTARRKGLQGEAVLRVLVNASGQPERIEIMRSSGHRLLDRAALAAVRDWRFRPATDVGAPIASWVEIPITFRLEAH